MESAEQLAPGTKVRIVGGCYFGETGTVVRVLLKAELQDGYYAWCDLVYLVEIQPYGGSTIVSGGSIALVEDFSEEALARAKASGASYEVDDGKREFLFPPGEVKRFCEEPFWHLYEEREAAHHGEVRRRANRAANLWRNHHEEAAVELARSCHPVNLLLSAQGRSHGFRRGTRLNLEGWVRLCETAGRDALQLADILYHTCFENRMVHLVHNLVPYCTCTQN